MLSRAAVWRLEINYGCNVALSPAALIIRARGAQAGRRASCNVALSPVALIIGPAGFKNKPATTTGMGQCEPSNDLGRQLGGLIFLVTIVTGSRSIGAVSMELERCGVAVHAHSLSSSRAVCLLWCLFAVRSSIIGLHSRL